VTGAERDALLERVDVEVRQIDEVRTTLQQLAPRVAALCGVSAARWVEDAERDLIAAQQCAETEYERISALEVSDG